MFLIIVVCSATLFFIMRDKDEVALKKLQKKERKARMLAYKQEKKEAMLKQKEGASNE